jgi:hypothetical protein
MRPTTTFPYSSTWKQAYNWSSNVVQDLQHHGTTGWSATAVWGFGGRLSSAAVWNAKAVWGTFGGERAGAALSTGRSSLAIRPESNLSPAVFAAAGGWSLRQMRRF